MTIFDDAVKLEVQEDFRRELIGWFPDEVSAMTAAFERTLIRSAILPELRRLPEVVIQCEYRQEQTKRQIDKFRRGTVVKYGQLGRRVIRLPGALQKDWLR